MRRPAVVTALVVVVVAVAAFVGWAVGRGADDPLGDDGAVALATAAVERTDLVRVRDLSGELGFGPTSTALSRRTGTVTWLPADGTLLEAGDAVVRIDEAPVVLLEGRIPAYRVLATSVDDGPDVRELEQNLAALGHLDADLVDESFTASTRRAVEALQESVGLDETGRIEPGDVLVAPGPRRLDRARVGLGDLVAVGTPLVELTSSDPAVTLEVGADDRRDLSVDDEVGVVLPDDRRTTGTVESIAAAPSPIGPDGRPTGEARFEITIGIDLEGDLPVEGTTVTVEVTEERADDALVVPVAALLALAEGGYAVEVVEGDAPPPGRLVAVELGVFSAARVQVSGELSPGDRVVVPRR